MKNKTRIMILATTMIGYIGFLHFGVDKFDCFNRMHGQGEDIPWNCHQFVESEIVWDDSCDEWYLNSTGDKK